MARGDKNFGLKFHYKINDELLLDRYSTVEDFLSTSFPKNNNPLSPNYNTEIFDLKWHGKRIFTNKNIHTVKDLIDLLNSGNVIIADVFTPYLYTKERRLEMKKLKKERKMRMLAEKESNNLEN